jgi:hypothetical protein
MEKHMQKIIFSHLFTVTIATSSFLCAQDSSNAPESLRERKHKLNAFVYHELQKKTPIDEINNKVVTEFYAKTSEYNEHKRLKADKERLLEDWNKTFCNGAICEVAIREAAMRAHQCAQKALNQAELVLNETPERQMLKKLYDYGKDVHWAKTYAKRLKAIEDGIQRNIGAVEQQNQIIRDSFISFQQSSNMASHSLQQREKVVNEFVRQKLIEGTSIEAIERQLEEQFCKQIPEHHTIGWLDREELRLGNCLMPCRREELRSFRKRDKYCYELKDKFEECKRKLKMAREERENTPEMQASKKLSDYRANEVKIEKFKRKLPGKTEEIRKRMQECEHHEKTMFNKFSKSAMREINEVFGEECV